MTTAELIAENEKNIRAEMEKLAKSFDRRAKSKTATLAKKVAATRAAKLLREALKK